MRVFYFHLIRNRKPYPIGMVTVQKLCHWNDALPSLGGRQFISFHGLWQKNLLFWRDSILVRLLAIADDGKK